MNSYPIIVILDETSVDTGNKGVAPRWRSYQEWNISFATESGDYFPAPPEEFISWRHTFVFYVSGVVAEAGGFVTLTSNGNVPAEFNGKVLTAGAQVVTPEIFLSKFSQATEEPEEPETPQPPRADDGKVSDPLAVFALFHNDQSVPNWRDSSTYTRTVTEVGLPELDQLKYTFGTGSLKCPDNGQVNGLRVASPVEEGFVFDDFSFTFEARLRFDQLAGQHTLMSYGNADNTLFEIRAKFYQDEFMEDKQSVYITWLRDDSEPDPGQDPVEPEFVEIELTKNAWILSPDDFQQTAIVYDKTVGEFAVFVSGERVGFYNATLQVDPPWNSISLPLYVEPEGGWPDGEPIERNFTLGAGSYETTNGFIGRMDEARWTVSEALYDVRSDAAQVYTFPWPNPVVSVPPP